jgi:hypothetical protein
VAQGKGGGNKRARLAAPEQLSTISHRGDVIVRRHEVHWLSDADAREQRTLMPHLKSAILRHDQRIGAVSALQEGHQPLQSLAQSFVDQGRT